jgi:hypothetical protein
LRRVVAENESALPELHLEVEGNHAGQVRLDAEASLDAPLGAAV